MIHLPIQESLTERIEALFNAAYAYAQSLHKSPLITDISKLWQTLTVERADGLPGYFKNPALRRAYLGYYMPLYAAKMALLMRQLVDENNLSDADPSGPNVMDLGSGPLVGVVANYLAFGSLQSALAVDREIGPMRQGLDFLRAVLGNDIAKRIYIKRANLAGPDNLWRPRGQVDVAILSHVLNEFGSSRREIFSKVKLVKSAIGCLSANGRLLIVEPATRVSTRELMALRDELAQDSSVKIWAPCTGALRCPLLETRDGWCHGELSWQRPDICKRIDDKIGFDKSMLKYSYLLLGRGDFKETAIKNRERIVSGKMEHEGIARRYACTSSGIITLSEKVPSIISSYYRGQLMATGYKQTK